MSSPRLNPSNEYVQNTPPSRPHDPHPAESVPLAPRAGATVRLHQLYRHFDKDGALLYVGISLSAVERLRQHRDSSHWFKKIARITIERHPTREDAEWAEREAIHRENPKHNKVRTIPPEHTCEPPTDVQAIKVRFSDRPGPFTVGQVAKILNAHRSVVNELIRVGYLGSMSWLKPVMVDKLQLIEYIESFNMDPHL